MTKCNEIFDSLVKDGQIIVPLGAKMSSLEQRKKRGFCKYHNFLGHKTSQYFLFRDLMHNAIKDRRLKFGDKGKSQMKIDSNPLQVTDAHYTEPTDVNMIEATEGIHNKGPMVETDVGFKQGVEMTKAPEDLRVRL